MSTPAGVQRAAPWVLCGITLTLLTLAAVVHLATRDRLHATTEDTVVFVAGCVSNASAPVVGGLLARRMPSNPFGWLLLAMGFGISLFAALPAIRQAGVVHYWVGGCFEFAVFLALIPMGGLVLLLFPDGRLPGPRWRWLPRATVLSALALGVVSPLVSWEGDPLAANPWALPATPDNPAASTPWVVRGTAGERLSVLYDVGTFVLLSLGVTALGSIVVRFRRAEPAQRQQLKWFLFAGALVVATVVPDIVDIRIREPVWPSLAAAAFGLLPVGVGIAVLRYRLYDIDRIVSRTVSYGLLTAGLVALYLLLVALLRPLLAPLTGSSALAVAGSTLAVAALFDPARRRLQAAVDRRFDRTRYDASRAVDAFAARLRDQVDLDEVITGLRDTVVATVAPARVAVWLRVPSPPQGAGS